MKNQRTAADLLEGAKKLAALHGHVQPKLPDENSNRTGDANIIATIGDSVAVDRAWFRRVIADEIRADLTLLEPILERLATKFRVIDTHRETFDRVERDPAHDLDHAIETFLKKAGSLATAIYPDSTPVPF